MKKKTILFSVIFICFFLFSNFLEAQTNQLTSKENITKERAKRLSPGSSVSLNEKQVPTLENTNIESPGIISEFNQSMVKDIRITPKQRSDRPLGNKTISVNENTSIYDGDAIAIMPSNETQKNIFENNNVVLSDGYLPQIATAENGDLYVCLSKYDSDYTEYLMFYVYKSVDNGANWTVAGGAYSVSQDLQYADIEVIDDRYLVIYERDNKMRLQWRKFDNSEYDFLSIDGDENRVAYWGSILSDKFYYSISSTWLYVTYASETYVNDAWEVLLYYCVSTDKGLTWSTPLAIETVTGGAYRPGTAIAYTTPDPGYGNDWICTTWRDSNNNGHIALINPLTEELTTKLILPAYTGDSGWKHGAPSISTYYSNIFVTSNVYWGSDGYSSADISITFSYDSGNTWGEDSPWYYWYDSSDEHEKNPTPVFSLNGVMGFSWFKGSEILFRTNSTGNFLQGWEPQSLVSGSIPTDASMIGCAIDSSTSTFHLVYETGSNYKVYYHSEQLEQKKIASISGRVTNALDGQPLNNVTVSIAGLTDLTDELGKYLIENVPPGFLQANFSGNPNVGNTPLTVNFLDQSSLGTQSLIATRAGFLTYANTNVNIVANETTTLNFSLSPDLLKTDIRFVLNWGDTPLDLDAHLITPDILGQPYHIYFGEKGSSESAPYAQLDYDITSGFGPETMSISTLFNGIYTFFVYNYSQTPDIINSNAIVNIYNKSGLIASIAIPKSGSGLYWKVCEIDGSTGQLTIINAIEENPPLKMEVFSEVSKETYNNKSESIGWSWDFGDGNFSSNQNPQHVYNGTGLFSVKLTITDGGNQSTLTRSNYISVTSLDAPSLLLPANGISEVLSPIDFSWNAVTGANSYKFQLAKTSSFISPVIDTSLAGTSFQFIFAEDDTRYYWRANSSDESNTSNWSSIWTFSTAKTVPESPSLSFPDSGATGISTDPILAWNSSIGADSYRLRVSDISNFTTTIFDQSGLLSTSQQINDLQENTAYYWQVNASNNSGPSDWSGVWYFTTGTISGIEGDEILPKVITLYQNYPNPFNPTTNIRFSVPNVSKVKISIYNLKGQEVKILTNETYNLGFHNIEFDASNMSSGIYFYRLQAEGFTSIKKMQLIK